MPQAPYGSRRALSALPGCQPRLWPAHRRRVAQAARAEVLRLRHRRLLASGLHQRGRAGVRRRRPQRLRRGCVRHIQLQGNQRRARRRGRRRSPLHRVRCPEGQLESPRGFATAWRRETSRSTTSPSCAPKTGRSARRRRSCAGSTRRWGPSPPGGGVRARARTGQSDIDARLPRPAPGARAPRVARATGREPRADIDEPLAAGFLQRPSHERDLQPCRKRDGSEGLHQLRSGGIISRELAGYLHLPARADPRYGREGPAGRFWQRILVAWHGRQLPVRRREDRQVLRRRDRGQDDGARRNRLDNRDVPPHRHEDGRRGRRDARSSRPTSSTWST